ncbi:PilZ domain-containing protein [Peribacillus sp. SCS-155]|uniref:PilZ domain-containing protein n=1 Tax=Peribacillus sedimenti TaxID=3115297 RepID=UPI0039065BC9
MDRRTEKRVNFKQPKPVKAKIHQLGNRSLPSGTAEVKIENISLNGLRFSSDLDFPITKEMDLTFEIELLGEHSSIAGSILWKEKIESGYMYGVEINITNPAYIKSIAYITSQILG